MLIYGNSAFETGPLCHYLVMLFGNKKHHMQFWSAFHCFHHFLSADQELLSHLHPNSKKGTLDHFFMGFDHVLTEHLWFDGRMQGRSWCAGKTSIWFGWLNFSWLTVTWTKHLGTESFPPLALCRDRLLWKLSWHETGNNTEYGKEWERKRSYLFLLC